MSQSGFEDEVESSSAPLIEHLAELRTRLIWCVLAVAIAISLFFVPLQGKFIAEHILIELFNPIASAMRAMGNENPSFQFTSSQELLFAQFKVAMVFGVGVAFPVIAFQLWRFVAPGLYKSEKSAFLPFIIASPLMFLLGASFAHFVVTPLAITFLIGFADFSSIVDLLTASETVHDDGLKFRFDPKVNENLRLVLTFIMAFGLCFQLPVLLTLMGKAGLVSAEGLGAVRKYAMVGILILAALVTPPDVVTQLILFTVVYGLYEVSIFLVARVEKKREARLRAEGYYDDEEEEDLADDIFGEGEDFDDPLEKEFDEDDDDGMVDKT